MMPDNLPKKLPPHRKMDHHIKLVPSAKPPIRTTYRVSQPELVELRKQVNELLDASLVQLAKLTYRAPSSFRRNKAVP